MTGIHESEGRTFDTRRRTLGMTFDALAARSGVSVPTVKRILGRHLDSASFGNVAAVASALGVPVGLGAQSADPDTMIHARARELAERAARLVQGTCALESQAVDAPTYRRIVERTYHELLAGPRRRLWLD